MRAVFNLIAKIDRNMDGWTCVEPVEIEQGEFEPTLQEFLQDGEDCVDGEEMVRRAKEKGALTGIRHAEAMLRNQERIPESWRKYYLVFPEVWQGPRGRRRAFCLHWSGSRWYLRYYWLEFDFRSLVRLVASRKYQKSLDS
jgi:hypothetical protein